MRARTAPGSIGVRAIQPRSRPCAPAHQPPAHTTRSPTHTYVRRAEKKLLGSLYGSSNPRVEIPKLLDLYKSGGLKLERPLITREYTLEEINQGYEDMRNGINLRGLIRY